MTVFSALSLRSFMQQQRTSAIVWLCFAILTLSWGSSFLLVKRGLQGGFMPDEVASVRMVSALAVLGIPAGWSLRRIPRAKLPFVVLSGWLSMFIPAYLFAHAQVHIPSAVASILNALTPACTFLIGILLYRQPVRYLQILGLLVGFAGSALLILTSAQGGFSLNIHALLIVAATVCYGLNVNMVKKMLAGVPAIPFSMVAVSVAGVSALVYLLLSGGWRHIGEHAVVHPWAFGAIVLLGAMGTAMSQVVFNYMLTLTSSVFASSITYFIPIVAVMWGVLDGEVLRWPHFVGMGCIIGGILLLNKAK